MPMLPLDLHVLSLSLAFILSQDQTLRCVYRFLFFSEKRHPTARAPRSFPITPHWLRPGAARAARDILTCHLGILTGDPRNPFLVSHLLVRFPHRKHFNDRMPPGARHVFDKASKKPLNSDRVLVSRKAMQNYNRFPTWQNISGKKFEKKSLFSVLEGFGTQRRRFGTPAGGAEGRLHHPDPPDPPEYPESPESPESPGGRFRRRHPVPPNHRVAGAAGIYNIL